MAEREGNRDVVFRTARLVAALLATMPFLLLSSPVMASPSAGQGPAGADGPPRLTPAGPAGATPVGPWSALGSNGAGNGALTNTVTAIAVSGSDVYVGGTFTNAAGIPEADFIAKWDGSTWSALGSNGAGNGALNGDVNALAVSGGDLYVGGNFTNAAGIPEADYVAKWDGSAWSALGSNGAGNGALQNDVSAVAASGSDVYVGGIFLNAGGVATADYVAEWDGSAWSGLGSNGSGNGAIENGGCVGCVVNALALSGSDLYVGGGFSEVAGNPKAANVAMWDGSAWSALGPNPTGGAAVRGGVFALAVSGSDLYVGGGFREVAGDAKAANVAMWDGSAWSALGSNASGGAAVRSGVFALAVSGGDLYVGGGFNNVAAIPEADFIARWNGSAWSALGSSGSGNGALSNWVRTLAAFGGDVYAGGQFGVAGNPKAASVAMWDGSAWSALGTSGSRFGPITNGSGVLALATSTTDLYMGCGCSDVAGIPEADFVAAWALGGPPSAPTAFRSSVPTPGQVNLDPVVVAQSLALAGGVIVLVPFPGALFNSTLRANYDEITERLRRARRRLRRSLRRPFDAVRRRAGAAIAAAAPAEPAEPVSEVVFSSAAAEERHDLWWTPVGVGIFVVLTALLSGFLDPSFGPDEASIATFVGMLIGLVVVLVAFDLPLAVFCRRRAVEFWMRALPATAAVSVACVLISRLTDFQPGYLYGLVIAIVVATKLDTATEGRLLAAGDLLSLAVAVAAWFALGLVAPLASGADPSPLLVLVQTALSMVVVAGVEAGAFGMLPLSFLAGESVKRWNVLVWAALMAVGWVAFGMIIMNPQNGYLSDTTRTPLITIVVLLVLFSVGSLAFWYYFHRRSPEEKRTGV